MSLKSKIRQKLITFIDSRIKDTLNPEVEKLTGRLDELGSRINMLENKYDELIGWNSDRMREIQYLQNDWQVLKNWNSDRMNEIQDLQNENAARIANIEELRSWNADRMSEIIKIQSLNMSDEYFEDLNLKCSAHPTIWGDKSRLHISSTAAVFTCMFNVNSGEIYIGDYSFAGSGVSILAGSHDTNLTGLSRRDAELHEGCDIKIGNGVWLASNSTILGPAIIGDNAVIAAGAVVVPGSNVEENSIYAGVPAKKIGVINECSNAVIEAIKREDGVLFFSGWSDKKIIEIDGKRRIAHYYLGNEGIIYTTKSNIILLLYKECKFMKEISINKDENVEKNVIDDEITICTENLLYESENINIIKITGNIEIGKIMVVIGG